MSKKLSTFSDEDLIELIRSKPRHREKAFAAIYNRYAPQVHSYCRMMIKNHDHAEDIFQESFIRFYKSIDENFEVKNIPGFVTKIARNLSLNYHRDKKHTVPVEDITTLIEDPNHYEKKELLDLVFRAIDLLDDKYKEAFVLKKVEGLSLKEIAEILNITLEGAKTRVNRARLKLLDILEPYMKDLSK